ncbi:hypothetical protein GPECTOR_421g280 [Gonium pectorale]|uniref:Copper transport protein n=1 Tax=Gonium pectorale TaxID=33097 RepID=A0A150FV71_GONPE|nr:hypothetical protein GPECTOR_421g280 [Gonium pectorale]|eukprot:KXZ41512.1 hypothetical protein GPECTOR_421g280 [Gonium pectorale]
MDAAMHDHDHGAMASMGMGMPMAFEYGYKTTLWFSSLRTDTVASYAAVLLGVFLLAVLHEGLAAHRQMAQAGRALPGAASSEQQLEGLAGKRVAHVVAGPSERLRAAALHVLSLGLGYLLMLAAMSMNAGVFVALLAGFGAGFFAFHSDRASLGPLTLTVRSDACHA